MLCIVFIAFSSSDSEVQRTMEQKAINRHVLYITIAHTNHTFKLKKHRVCDLPLLL